MVFSATYLLSVAVLTLMRCGAAPVAMVYKAPRKAKHSVPLVLMDR